MEQQTSSLLKRIRLTVFTLIAKLDGTITN